MHCSKTYLTNPWRWKFRIFQIYAVKRTEILCLCMQAFIICCFLLYCLFLRLESIVKVVLQLKYWHTLTNCSQKFALNSFTIQRILYKSTQCLHCHPHWIVSVILSFVSQIGKELHPWLPWFVFVSWNRTYFIWYCAFISPVLGVVCEYPLAI